MTDKPHMTLPNGDKLFEGDYGRTRDGRKVGPMEYDGKTRTPYVWDAPNGDSFTRQGFIFDNSVPAGTDIIAKWTEAPAQPETGTLAELNVKPGDVVEYLGDGREADDWGYPEGDSLDRTYTIQQDGSWFGVAANFIHELTGKFRIVSRASDAPKSEAPKLWRDMTPEEKGALLLAHHEGKVIEIRTLSGKWAKRVTPLWHDTNVYRIRPEPKRETVAICYRAAHGQWREIGTIDLIDGEPDTTTIRMESLK